MRLISDHKKLSYNQGIGYALACYVVWGLFPIFWKAITGVPAVNVLAHRIVWSFLFLLVWVLLICFTFVWAGLACYTISILKGKRVTIAK